MSAERTEENSMTQMFRSGFDLRWINNAGFEVVLPEAPTSWWIRGWTALRSIPCRRKKIERADYILLTHIHFDHADSTGAVRNVSRRRNICR